MTDARKFGAGNWRHLASLERSREFYHRFLADSSFTTGTLLPYYRPARAKVQGLGSQRPNTNLDKQIAQWLLRKFRTAQGGITRQK